ncbi:hypothetical protein GGG16DRAFT_114058 [Schizophyllum commune]
MSADHAHDVEHSALPHDLELKRTRATSENHTERRDGPPQLPSLVLGLLSRCYSYDTLKKLIHKLEKPKDDTDQSYRDFEAHKRASFVGDAASSTASAPASRKFGALGKAHTLATDTLYLYKRRIATRYTSFTSLKSFLKVNYSGLRNILKKYLASLLVLTVCC